MSSLKEINVEIKWIDDECVGIKCKCGYDEEELVVGIYKDGDYQCPKCKRKYILKQTNCVYEIKE